VPGDIRVAYSFKGHRKRKKLSRLLKTDATGYILDLWITAAQTRPDGDLKDWDEMDIADAAGYQGDPDGFVQALIKCQLLEATDNGCYCLHDWRTHQPYVFYAPHRQTRARKAAAARYSTKWKKQKKVIVQCAECDAKAPVDVLVLDDKGVCTYCREGK